MIIGVRDPSRYLYHYTKLATARDYILKDWTLLMSSFRQMNDPKESKSWEFNLGSNQNRDLAKYKSSELSLSVSSPIKENSRVLCFSKDKDGLSGDHMRDISLRGFAKPRMWAQYAERHSGVCLVFDSAILADQVMKSCAGAWQCYRGSVEYRDRSVVPSFDEGDYFIDVDLLEKVGASEYWKKHVHFYRKRLLFEKMADWQDEREYRFVAVLDKPTTVYVDVRDCLVGVVFGDAAPENDVETVIEMLLPTKIEMMGLRWSNCSPWYDFGSLRFDRQARLSPWFKKLPNPDLAAYNRVEKGVACPRR